MNIEMDIDQTTVANQDDLVANYSNRLLELNKNCKKASVSFNDESSEDEDLINEALSRKRKKSKNKGRESKVFKMAKKAVVLLQQLRTVNPNMLLPELVHHFADQLSNLDMAEINKIKYSFSDVSESMTVMSEDAAMEIGIEISKLEPESEFGKACVLMNKADLSTIRKEIQSSKDLIKMTMMKLRFLQYYENLKTDAKSDCMLLATIFHEVEALRLKVNNLNFRK
jgi:hypothetical protein